MEYLWLIVALLVGLFLMWVFYKVMIGGSVNTQTLQSKHYTTQSSRTAELNRLLWQIKSTPENSRAELWRKYMELEAIDQQQTAIERAEIVNSQTVIDERTQFELDNGINPYTKPAKTPAAKLAKARR